MQRQFLGTQVPELCSSPKDYNAAAGTIEYLNMSKYARVTFIITTGAWAAGTAAVTINEATTVAGGSAQALTFTEMFTNKAVATVPVDLGDATAVTSSTFNLDTADSVWVIDITADMLSDGFDCLAVVVATPGANADLYSVLAIAGEPRYAAETMVDPTL